MEPKLRFSDFMGMALLPRNYSKLSVPKSRVRKERSDHFARPITSTRAGDRDFPKQSARIRTPIAIDKTTDVPSLPPMHILASGFEDNDTPPK
jgi:hypothetical protein